MHKTAPLHGKGEQHSQNDPRKGTWLRMSRIVMGAREAVDGIRSPQATPQSELNFHRENTLQRDLKQAKWKWEESGIDSNTVVPEMMHPELALLCASSSSPGCWAERGPGQQWDKIVVTYHSSFIAHDLVMSGQFQSFQPRNHPNEPSQKAVKDSIGCWHWTAALLFSQMWKQNNSAGQALVCSTSVTPSPWALWKVHKQYQTPFAPSTAH